MKVSSDKNLRGLWSNTLAQEGINQNSFTKLEAQKDLDIYSELMEELFPPNI